VCRRAIDRRTFLAVAIVATSAITRAEADERPRVLHIDSYHQGNQWNDQIAAAVRETLEAEGVEVRVIHLDTKRHPSEGDMRAAAAQAVSTIDSYQPHVVTLSDDNAVKYVLMEHYRDADLPFVFSGLNWDASVYGLPYENATGMVEVSPIPQLLRLLQRYAAGPRLGILTEDTPTKHKEVMFHERLFGIVYDRTYYVSSFPAWQDAFLTAQREVDALVVLGVGALTDWDHDAAETLARTHSRIPSGTDFEWLMPYAMLGVVKLPEEQGEWSARAALQILDGVAPSRIPLTHNTRGKLIFNPAIARRVGVDRAPPLAHLHDG